MLKTILTTFLSIMCTIYSIGQTKEEIRALPDSATLKAINDSICMEGYMLYLLEKKSWVASDEFVKYQRENTDNHIDPQVEISMFTYPASEHFTKTIFYNTDSVKCYFECLFDDENETMKTIDQERGLDEMEQALTALRSQVEKAIDLSGIVKTYSKEYGSLNMEMMPLNENLIRVYILQGTIKNRSIPFGNDYCFDFDGDGNLIKSTKFHSTLINLEWQGETPLETYHSHLKNNPYITATDICTFLLYCYDLYGMTSFEVVSTAFNKAFRFDANTFSISVEEIKDQSSLSK